jgi:hypothetical protein
MCLEDRDRCGDRLSVTPDTQRCRSRLVRRGGWPGSRGGRDPGICVIHCSGVRCISDKPQVSKTAKPGAPGEEQLLLSSAKLIPNPEMGR